MKHSNELVNQQDDFLIELFQNGDDEVFNVLFYRYFSHAKRLSTIYYLQSYAPGLNEDDFLSVCLSSFQLALKRYKTGANRFKAYWEKISFHEIQKMLKDNNRHFNNGNLSFDAHIKKGDDMTYSEVIGFIDNRIHQTIDKNEAIAYVSDNPNSNLSEEEKEIFLLYISDYSIKNIAKMMFSNPKHIRYIIDKVHKKLAKLKNIK